MSVFLSNFKKRINCWWWYFSISNFETLHSLWQAILVDVLVVRYSVVAHQRVGEHQELRVIRRIR